MQQLIRTVAMLTIAVGTVCTAVIGAYISLHLEANGNFWAPLFLRLAFIGMTGFLVAWLWSIKKGNQ